jgi:hypothetical protein
MGMRNGIGVHRARTVRARRQDDRCRLLRVRAFRIPIPVLCSVFVLFLRREVFDYPWAIRRRGLACSCGDIRPLGLSPCGNEREMLEGARRNERSRDVTKPHVDPAGNLSVTTLELTASGPSVPA